MPCDSRPYRRGQTLEQRKLEVKEVVNKIQGRILQDKVRVVVDKKTGAVAFDGLTETDKDGVTDACIYRRIMTTGTMTAKLAIMKAEQMAGRTVNREAVNAGIHSHDGGKTFHEGH